MGKIPTNQYDDMNVTYPPDSKGVFFAEDSRIKRSMGDSKDEPGSSGVD